MPVASVLFHDLFKHEMFDFQSLGKWSDFQEDLEPFNHLSVSSTT